MKKMRFLLWVAAFAAMALTACQVEEPEAPEAPVVTDSVSFSATTEAAATKTALEGSDAVGYQVIWQSGDEIYVTDGADTPNAGRYATDADGVTSASFAFVPASGTEATTPDFVAWYPASIYDGGTVAYPATQEYVEGNISGAPMFAKSGTTSMNFVNLGGILRLSLSTSQAGIAVRSITLTADSPLSGTITNAGSLSSVAPVAATVSGSAGVTLDCGVGGVAINGTPKDFHIAVPAGEYTNLRIKVTTTDGAFQTRTSNKAIVVSRSNITPIRLSFNSISHLVQYWPFDGDATNAIAGGVDATVFGATLTTDRFGRENGAYYFDGNDKMIAPGAAEFGKSSFTASVWVNSTGSGNLLRTDGGYYKGWLLRFNSGYLEIWEGRDYNIAYVSSRTYNDGNWHMVTFVRDVENRLGKLYVDGGFVGSYAMDPSVTNNVSNELRFGSYGDGEYYTGKMDDARLYDVALSADEVAALYKETACVDLSATETANCYVVPEGGLYKFRATAKGNGLADLAGVSRTTDAASIASASLVWASFSTAVAPTENELIKDIRYNPSDGYVYFSTGDVYKEGNAIVAVKDGSGNILWSWHLWICNYGQYYFTGSNGVKMMTRNLGGLNSGTSSLSFGMYYQWGRKDPFVGPSSGATMAAVYGAAKSIQVGSVSVETAIRNPTNYYVECNTAGRWTNGDHWCSDDTKLTLWSASGKTIFDPCPPGWRTPSFSEITGMGTASSVYTTVNGFGAYGYVNTNGVFVDESNGTLWSTTVNGSCAKIQVVLGDYSTWDRSPDMGFNIRCVKVE